LKKRIILFILLFTLLISCSEKTKNFTEPKLTFTKEKFTIENTSHFDYYNIEIAFANKYYIEYNFLPKKSKVSFTYREINPASTFQELNKNKVLFSFQDSIGNNYGVQRNKLVFVNSQPNNSDSFWEYIKKANNIPTNILTIILAFLAAITALHQVKSNVISTSRIKWIEDFKNNITEYNVSVSQACHNYVMYTQSKKPNLPAGNYKFYEEYVKYHYKSSIHQAKLLITLNLSEKAYRDIETTIDEITANMDLLGDTLDLDGLIDLIEKQFLTLTKQTQFALKIEWEKQKKIFYVKWVKKKE